MTPYEFWTLIGMSTTLFITVIGGFVWMLHRIDQVRKDLSLDIRSLDNRLSRMGGYLEGYFGNSKRTGS